MSRYAARIEGELSGVDELDDDGHRTEAAAYDCLARWLSREAKTYRAAARQARLLAKRLRQQQRQPTPTTKTSHERIRGHDE